MSTASAQAASGAGANHKKEANLSNAPAVKRLEKLIDPVQDVNTATWMHDLAPFLWQQKLGQVVIPGSHDSASYSLDGQLFGAYAMTQIHDFTCPWP